MRRPTWWRTGSRLALGLAVLTGASLGLSSEARAVPSAIYFLKIAGIDGEATHGGHANEIDVLSFSFDFTHRRGCGDFKVIKNIDKASAKLMLSAVLGTVHPTAILSGVTSGELSVDFLKLTLVNAMVTAVNLSDTSGIPPAIETVTFGAQRIELEYTPQRADGSLGSPVRAVIDCGRGGGPAARP